MCGLEVFCLSLSLPSFLPPSLSLSHSSVGGLRVQNCIQDEAAPLCCDTFTVLLQLDQPSYSFWHSPMRESRYSYRKMKGRKEKKARSVRAGRKRWEAIPRKRQTCLRLKAYIRNHVYVYTYICTLTLHNLKYFSYIVAIWSMVELLIFFFCLVIFLRSIKY